jgi:hypothetical protein
VNGMVDFLGGLTMLCELDCESSERGSYLGCAVEFDSGLRQISASGL